MLCNPSRRATIARWLPRATATLGVVVASLSPAVAQSVSSVAADPFARYTTPGQCEQATLRMTRQYWRDRRRDTLRFAPEVDSLPASVIRSARACAARFTVEGSATRELLDLGQLYLQIGNDSLARMAFDRLIAAQPSAARGRAYHQIVGSTLAAIPTRRAMAQAYVTRVDALGASAAQAQLDSHLALADYALTVNDRGGAAMAARAAIAASRRMTSEGRRAAGSTIVRAYVVLAEIAAAEKDGAAALAILDSAAADLAPLGPSSGLAEVQGSSAPRRTPYQFMGTPAPPIQALRWYARPSAGEGDSVVPRRGHVTLTVSTYASCGGLCYEMYAVLRRLHAKYGDAGLDIVLLVATNGYFRNSPTSSPVAEADSSAKYLLQFLALPAMLAVEETPFTVRAIDRRKLTQQPVNLRHYFRGVNGVVVDAQGVVRFLSNVIPTRERLLDAVIGEAIRAPRSDELRTGTRVTAHSSPYPKFP